MLPQNAISAVAYSAAFQSPDSTIYNPLVDYERGGIAISDTSEGRLYQDWACFVDEDVVYVAPATDLASRTALVSATDVTTVSLAFDVNMRPAITYMQLGVLKLYWYDSLTETYITTSIPDATSGRLATDDKRVSQEGISDIIFAYVKLGSLYYRQQRDRYTVERFIGDVTGTLTRIGMNEVNRMQFEVEA